MGEVFQLEAWFSGHVQGVGFRYTVLQAARGYEVAGQVRNLPDGRVHLEAEGKEAEVRGLLGEVQAQMRGYIRETQTAETRGKARHRGFQIGR